MKTLELGRAAQGQRDMFWNSHCRCWTDSTQGLVEQAEDRVLDGRPRRDVPVQSRSSQSDTERSTTCRMPRSSSPGIRSRARTRSGASKSCGLISEKMTDSVPQAPGQGKVEAGGFFRRDVQQAARAEIAALWTHRSLNKGAPLHRAIERLGAVVSRPVCTENLSSGVVVVKPCAVERHGS